MITEIVMPLKNGRMKKTDLYWLAGLLEGEGCFDFHYKNRNTGRGTPRIQLNMTDHDTVRRAADLMGKTYVGTYPPAPQAHKLQHRFSICGDSALRFMKLLYPLMSSRRRQQIDTSIKLADQRPGTRRDLLGRYA